VDPEYPSAFSGICVTGAAGVRVSGFSVRQFSVGILVVGATNTVVDNNRLIGNKEYGVFDIASTGSVIRANTATRSNDAGIYVGDSPNAQATVQANVAYDNALGIFIRSASKGQIVNNDMHDNCVRLVFLDAPNPSTHWLAKDNVASNNNRTRGCDGGITGVGIASLGGRDITIGDNAANNNQGQSFLSGGVHPAGPLFLRKRAAGPTSMSVRSEAILCATRDIA